MKLHLNIRAIWQRVKRVHQWILIVLFFLIALRLALPFTVESYVNHELNKAPDYVGKVGHIEMRLWRGGYRIHQINIEKRNGETRSPFFSAAEIDLSIQWRELLHGSAVGEIIARQPRVNFAVGSSEAQTQTGKNQGFDKILGSLFPFDLNRVEIINGEIHFENQSAKPPVDIYLSKISATATNLSNARSLQDKLPSGLVASGSTVGGGQLDLQLQMNLLKAAPTYQLNCALTNVDLTALNNFLRAYGKFDVAHGNFSIYTSVASDNGSYDGYFKVFFSNLDVFAWEKERKKNILEVFWQAIVGSVAEILKNHPKDQLAAKIPISGSYTNAHVGILRAAGTVLQNAFIHALVPKLDEAVTVNEVKKTDDKN